jgi:hypothetical protein
MLHRKPCRIETRRRWVTACRAERDRATRLRTWLQIPRAVSSAVLRFDSILPRSSCRLKYLLTLQTVLLCVQNLTHASAQVLRILKLSRRWCFKSKSSGRHNPEDLDFETLLLHEKLHQVVKAMSERENSDEDWGWLLALVTWQFFPPHNCHSSFCFDPRIACWRRRRRRRRS